MTLTRSMIQGILPALTTPIDRNGAVDRKATKVLVDHVIAGGAELRPCQSRIVQVHSAF